MKITSVKKDKNHTVKVDFDGAESVRIDTDFWQSLCLHCGDTVSPEMLEEYLKESEYIRAKSRALWFLDRADCSEKALFDKIVRGGISKTAAARAISRLKQLGMIDDYRYAEHLTERMIESNISKREAYAKLISKGIPKQTVSDILAEAVFDELQQIETLIDKKYRIKLESPDGVQKVYAALVRKGFSYSAVRTAIKNYTQQELDGDFDV